METKLINIVRDATGKTCYTLTELGEENPLLEFLINTSDFSWQDRPAYNKTGEHLLSKLCAIGYLLSPKDPKVSLAVIATNSIGAPLSIYSNGKTLFSKILDSYMKTLTIDGCRKELNTFQLSILEKHQARLLVVDNVVSNIIYNQMFNFIDNDWIIDRLAKVPLYISQVDAPRLLFTTPYYQPKQNPGFTRKSWILLFSDYYYYKPVNMECSMEELHTAFPHYFTDLKETCTVLYNTYGVV